MGCFTEMSFCGYQAPETDREKSIRLWETSKTIYTRLVKGCFNHVQLELYKNIVVRIDAIGIITYHYGNKIKEKKN